MLCTLFDKFGTDVDSQHVEAFQVTVSLEWKNLGGCIIYIQTTGPLACLIMSLLGAKYPR